LKRLAIFLRRVNAEFAADGDFAGPRGQAAPRMKSFTEALGNLSARHAG